jgi:hypothetical protein
MGSKSVIKYNLTNFRNRECVQAFFGRPVDFLCFEPTLTSCDCRPCLRFLVVQDCGAGLFDREEVAELEIENFAGDKLVPGAVKAEGVVCEELMAANSYGCNSASGLNAVTTAKRVMKSQT